MNISIFGLGYVGCVGMGCLASEGHKIIGVDINEDKINFVNQGLPTIVEPGIDAIFQKQHALGNIKATRNYIKAIEESEISFICVGTPSSKTGHLDLSYIYQTAKEIGEGLRLKQRFHIIVIRSTVIPGTNKKVGELIEEVSGLKRNKQFAVVSNPEFLREGTAIDDYNNPPLTVIGVENGTAKALMLELYSHLRTPIEIVSIGVAEMIKYVNNSFHALKVVFANEVGEICKTNNIDSHDVMRLFCMDNQLNISSYYFKPGFAYGGSCLPKDLRALRTMAHDSYLYTPVLNSIEESNQLVINKVVEKIISEKHCKIGVLGLSFKAGTDDMRNSPIINAIEILNGKGYKIKVFDKNVSISRLLGKNKRLIEEKLPHLNLMLQDRIETITEWAETIVITNKDESFRSLNLKNDQRIFDLVRISELEKLNNYEGLWW